jgi:hypothetical protein
VTEQLTRADCLLSGSTRAFGKEIIMKKHIDQILQSLSTIEEASLAKEVDSFDTNRDGTPYLVMLPEEIPWCLGIFRFR